MSNIEALFQVDFKGFVLTIFIILFGISTAIDIVGKVAAHLGKPIGWVKRNKEDHDLIIDTANEVKELRTKLTDSVHQSILHDKMIKDDLTQLSLSVKTLSTKLDNMQGRMDEAEVAKMRARLIEYYHKFRNADEWSYLDKDAFTQILREYENRGGDGYIHTIVVPVMEELRVVDK